MGRANMKERFFLYSKIGAHGGSGGDSDLYSPRVVKAVLWSELASLSYPL